MAAILGSDANGAVEGADVDSIDHSPVKVRETTAASNTQESVRVAAHIVDRTPRALLMMSRRMS